MAHVFQQLCACSGLRRESSQRTMPWRGTSSIRQTRVCNACPVQVQHYSQGTCESLSAMLQPMKRVAAKRLKRVRVCAVGTNPLPKQRPCRSGSSVFSSSFGVLRQRCSARAFTSEADASAGDRIVSFPSVPAPLDITAVLALGSNVGQRHANIQQCLRELPKDSIRVVDTSFMYNTKAQYIEDQPDFLNAACVVQTSLTSAELLAALKDIELRMGRDHRYTKLRYGPRPVDMDILFYGGQAICNDEPHPRRLYVPHPHLAERDFVTVPLADLSAEAVRRAAPPGYRVPTPSENAHMLRKCMRVNYDHRTAASRTQTSDEAPQDSSEHNSDTEEQMWHFGERTLMMGVVNCTPDSFSDGGRLWTEQGGLVMGKVEGMVAAGVDVIDVGGESTRPGATPLQSAEQELERVIPVIEAIRSHEDPAVASVCLSVDTYRAAVAREAVLAGANIVNDVSAGLFDDTMHSTVADLSVPYIAMHLRGNPRTMLQPNHTSYTDVNADVRTELLQRADSAIQAGVYRWNIILDPGLGFAKTPAQSLQLLRHGMRSHTETGKTAPSAALRSPKNGFPMMWGPSRKGFIGHVLNQRPGTPSPSSSDEMRLWGTAGAVCAAIASGNADIIRVHDVPQMSAAVRLFDAISRQ